MLAAVFATFILAEAASAYYSPRMGRFLNRDPLIGEEPGWLVANPHVGWQYSLAGSADVRRQGVRGNWNVLDEAEKKVYSGTRAAPGSISLYAYCYNAPINYMDLLGLLPTLRIYKAGVQHRVIWWDEQEWWDFGPENGQPLLCLFGCKGVANYLGNINTDKKGNSLQYWDKQLKRKKGGRLKYGGLGRGTPCWCAPESYIRSCLNEVRDEWDGTTYYLLTRNCITFALEAMGSCCLRE